MKINFSYHFIVIVAITCIISTQATAEGLNALIGVRYVDLDYSYSHDTHADDEGLPNAQEPGSAGTTNLGSSYWILAGGRYETKAGNVDINFDLGLLLGSDDDHKRNENDDRPDEETNDFIPYIYSDAQIGALAAIGANYDILDQLTLGIEAQVTGFYIESGWDRGGSKTLQDTTYEITPTIGPKIIYRFNENIGIEATIQFGKTTSGGINFILGAI